ncbi:flavin reductase (DIM6/NTAB) family NADH-FMN oxidoreductase RutF [Kribbella steppae]|uniref:Flavin reductase (DIM6/NTAB) family NADH-FMN oxidoreductase RutF n=1 Tax=Kribbella steppae TaxID=2512223 RepID=A0A4R2HFY6_9ACTN|nr:flavin reductase [Kribbella steppae]TCO28052.1 flavin reductase (DIM6/NTAB) family NADH-FMN oxidoreductase RutF [Kribbella steppae]
MPTPSPIAPAGQSLVTAREFRDVIGRFATGVTVITTANNGARFGSTASAVSSLTDDPPMLLVCLNRSSATAAAVRDSGTFAVNVLAEDHVDLATRFASRVPDKYDGVPTETASNGSPLLVGAIAHLICRVAEQVEAGTHYVFVAHVEEATSYPGHPLAYFRGRFGRMQTAPEASVLREVRAGVLDAGSDVEEVIDTARWAGELGVDANLIHRALVALADEGLIRREGGRYLITPVPDSIIDEVYKAKLAIELGVAESTVAHATSDQLARLRELMEDTLGFVQDGRFTDPEGWVQANERFHEYMVGLAGSAILLDTYRRLGLPGLNLRALDRGSYASRSLLDDHRELVEGYEAGDLARVAAVLRQHAQRPLEMRHQDHLLRGEPANAALTAQPTR